MFFFWYWISYLLKSLYWLVFNFFLLNFLQSKHLLCLSPPLFHNIPIFLNRIKIATIRWSEILFEIFIEEIVQFFVLVHREIIHHKHSWFDPLLLELPNKLIEFISIATTAMIFKWTIPLSSFKAPIIDNDRPLLFLIVYSIPLLCHTFPGVCHKWKVVSSIYIISYSFWIIIFTISLALFCCLRNIYSWFLSL